MMQQEDDLLKNEQQIFAISKQQHPLINQADGQMFRVPQCIQFPNNIKISKLVCGGHHILVLSNMGIVFTWSSEKVIPIQVQLDTPVDMISAGEYHSVVCNSEYSLIYTWGSYMNSINKAVDFSYQMPHRIYHENLNETKILKIISGKNHTLMLSQKSLFGWGDRSSFVLGQKLATKKIDDHIRVEQLGFKNVIDIFTGDNHAFIQQLYSPIIGEQIKRIIAWGNNDQGQLGIGCINSLQNKIKGVEVKCLRDKNIIDIIGGAHNTLILVEENQQIQVLEFGNRELQGTKQLQFEANICKDLGHIQKIVSVQDIYYALSEDSEIFSWGQSPIDSRQSLPIRMDLEFFDNQRVGIFGVTNDHLVVSNNDCYKFQQSCLGQFQTSLIQSSSLIASIKKQIPKFESLECNRSIQNLEHPVLDLAVDFKIKKFFIENDQSSAFNPKKRQDESQIYHHFICTNYLKKIKQI